MQPVKDQANLIHAFARVRERVPEAVLLLIGDGTLRGELERLAGELGLMDAVRFLGDRSDVDRLLRGLDIFALSSLSEGYSVALLEACAAGLPIVATDVGGNREIVRDQNNGLLVPAADPDALAAALGRLLQAPELTSTMGRAGRKWVLAEGSLRTMAERYLRLYAQPGGEGEIVQNGLGVAG
jgi:glycosyltransferase involved in cell wall biosynthesis